MFSPRGGSAHVTRALSGELAQRGWEVTLASGSRGDLGADGDAARFYSGVDVVPVDFSAALGEADPQRPRGDVPPMHPSFEERADAPDVVFASLDDLTYERQVRAWGQALERAGAPQADVLYLHHLTPVNEAAARVAPGVPVVGHLHGTELLMLEQILEGAPSSWRYAERWRERLVRWAQRCERLVVSPAGLDRARALLDLSAEDLVPLANGVDTALFRPMEIDRPAHWRRYLVEEPTARDPAGELVRYDESDLAAIREGVTLLYVGRFTKVKRLPFLLEAFAEARSRFDRPAALVLLGGHPGEWEGEHPVDAIRRLELDDAFVAGWHEQRALPPFLSAADAVVLPSEREQFGQTLIEGMACGRPGIAANLLGPSMILEDGETGWLFEDRAGLVEALIAAVNDPRERERRGAEAMGAAREHFAWPGLAARLDEVLGEVAPVRHGGRSAGIV